MRIYENILLPWDDWYITSILYLGDDGSFRYRETWSCYAGSVDAEAEGFWEQTGDVVMLETASIKGGLRLELTEGRKFRAFERDGSLDFGNEFQMRPPRDEPKNRRE